MWVRLLSKLVLWFLKLRYVMPYLQYMLPVVLFIICGNRARVITLLLFVTLVYDMIEVQAVKLIGCLYSALLSPLYFGSCLWETINNCTFYLFSSGNQSMEERSPYLGCYLLENINNCTFYLFSSGSQPTGETSSHIFLFSARLIAIALKEFVNFEYPWDVELSMVLLLGISLFLNVIQILSRVKQLFKSTTQRSAPTTAATPTLVTGTAATQTLATGTAATQTLATGTAATQTSATSSVATQTLATGTAATLIPMTSTVATQTPATGTVATQTLAMDDAAELENQPVPISIAPIQKRKYTKKSVRLAKDEGEAGSSREQEEEAEPEIITRSLSVSELRDMRKDFSRHPGEHFVRIS